MNAWYSLLRWVLVLAFLATASYAVPGIFLPGAAADLIGVEPPAVAVWPAFAFLLTFLVSLFHLVAAWNPFENLITVWLSVAARLAGALIWFCLFPGWPVVGWIDLAFGLVLSLLTILAVRTPSIRVA